jgi:type II secretory pathway pseudopilin PulG
MFKKNAHHTGITLAEVIISMAVIAIIATFNVQKIMTITEAKNRLVIVKDTLSTINGMVFSGMQAGSIRDVDTLKSYILANMNGVKTCDTSIATQGCWSNAVQGTTPLSTEYGFVLANGAVVSVVGWWGTFGLGPQEGVFTFLVDWNGIKGPNKFNTADADNDQFTFDMCFGKSQCSSWHYPAIPPGRITATGADPSGEMFLQNWQ